MKSALLKDATPTGLDMSQQLILELHVINCTLCAIHLTLKEVLYQIDLDWSEKEKKELSEEEEEESEDPEEMTLDEEVVGKVKEVKGKAKEN